MVAKFEVQLRTGLPDESNLRVPRKSDLLQKRTAALGHSYVQDVATSLAKAWLIDAGGSRVHNRSCQNRLEVQRGLWLRSANWLKVICRVRGWPFEVGGPATDFRGNWFGPLNPRFSAAIWLRQQLVNFHRSTAVVRRIIDDVVTTITNPLTGLATDMLRLCQTRNLPTTIAAWMAMLAIGIPPVAFAGATMCASSNLQVDATDCSHNAATTSDSCCCGPSNASCGCDGCQCGEVQQHPAVPLTVPPVNESSPIELLNYLTVCFHDALSMEPDSAHPAAGEALQSCSGRSALQTCAVLSRFLC